MSVLSSNDISREIYLAESEYGTSSCCIERISGDELSIQPSSIDLHLGDEFAYPGDGTLVDVADEATYPNFQFRRGPRYTIGPGEFALAHTDEYISLSPEVVGFLYGRSSVGRLGLFVHNAGLVDAGFEGQLTLELFNAAPYPIRLHEGMDICQMTLHHHDHPPNDAYNAENGAKYQDQMGVTPSRLFQDFQDQ